LLAILKGDIEIIHLPPKQRILEYIMFLNPVLKRAYLSNSNAGLGAAAARSDDERRAMLARNELNSVGQSDTGCSGAGSGEFD
jgi:hypothetical protein